MFFNLRNSIAKEEETPENTFLGGTKGRRGRKCSCAGESAMRRRPPSHRELGF